jgi:ABC-2 type transport system permease protein
VLQLAETPFGSPKLKAEQLAAPKLFTRFTDEDTGADRLPAPTSVQQNAPGWTLLAMFFLAIPMSVTFIREYATGGLQRLQTMPVPRWVLYGGKIVPYFIINQIQFVLILIVGIWGLPLLGGDRLTVGHSPAALTVLSFSASFAAIGFALLIATLARTPEQASTLSATLIMTLGAIGGVMVPTIIMPPFMQKLAEFSPFFWGLEGFLDVYVRGGGLREVWPECTKLFGFAVVCFVLALQRFRQRAHAT